MLKVTTFTINAGTPAQHYKLVSDDGNVLYYQPSCGWKTKNGAVRWAKRNGLDFYESHTDEEGRE